MGQQLFDEGTVYPLVVSWKATGDIKTLQEIITHVTPLLKSLAWKAYNTMPNPIEDVDDLVHDAIVKLPQVLADFEGGLGSKVFSYLYACMSNFLKSQIHKLSIRGMASYNNTDDDEPAYDVPVPDTIDNDDSRMDLLDMVHTATIPYFNATSKQILEYYIQAFKEGIFTRNRRKLSQTVAYMYDSSLSDCVFLYNHFKVCLRVCLLDVYISQNTDIIKLFDLSERTHIPRMVEVIGRESTEKLLMVFGGMTIRFPSLKKIHKLTSKVSIFKQMRGMLSEEEIKEIAKLNGISERKAKKIQSQIINLVEAGGDSGNLNIEAEVNAILSGDNDEDDDED